jgi:hypothetical protein
MIGLTRNADRAVRQASKQFQIYREGRNALRTMRNRVRHAIKR